jgi:hypothetical protein
MKINTELTIKYISIKASARKDGCKREEESRRKEKKNEEKNLKIVQKSDKTFFTKISKISNNSSRLNSYLATDWIFGFSFSLNE